MLRFSTLRKILLLTSDERTRAYLIKIVRNKDKLRQGLTEKDGRCSVSPSFLSLDLTFAPYSQVPGGSELDSISGVLSS